MSGTVEWRRQTTVSKASTLLDGLKAYYKLDEASGTVLDAVGDNDGTNYGALANQSTAKLGKAYYFNDYTDYIDMGNAADLSVASAGTLALWIYPTIATSNGTLISKLNWSTGRNGYLLGNNALGTYYRMALCSGTVEYYKDTTVEITLNEWQLVVFTWAVSGGTMKLYKNNADPYVDSSLAITPVSDVHAFRLGDNEYYGLAQVGYYDEVAVWNRALTATEVLELYNSGTGKTYPF